MTNYTTNDDLIADVLFRAGEPVSTLSDYYDAAIRYLNRVYHSLWRGGADLLPHVNEVWPWARLTYDASLVLKKRYESGLITAVNGSDAIVFSSAPSVSLDFFHLYIENEPIYRIVNHSAGSVNATIQEGWLGDSGTYAYEVGRFDYELPSDVLFMTGGFRYGETEIGQMQPETLARKYPLENWNEGIPSAFAIIGLNATNTAFMVRFSHCGELDKDVRLTYRYNRELADIEAGSDEILIPREYRNVVCDWALYFLLLDKEDGRAATVLQMATASLMAMVMSNKRSDALAGNAARPGRIYPRGRGR